MRIFASVKTVIPLLILCIISYFLWRGLTINPTLLPSPFINKSTPEFNLPTLENTNIQLNNKIFIGHVSLLNVWATWCAACANEYPILMDIYNTHQVAIYGLDYKDNHTAALQWINKYGNPFAAIGFDANGYTAINWGVYGTPETFIIDKQGIIRYKFIGELTHNVWQQTLLPLIKKLQYE